MPFILWLSVAGCAVAREPSSRVSGPPQTAAYIDFASVVRPILEARCAPCHFEGGTMHDRLPFDRPETIRMLGTKLFTRIKDEADQAAINAFLTQPPAEPASPGSP